jgi:hypothetical protein
MTVIANLGAMLTLFLGSLGLLFPKRICRLLGINPDGPLGVSELRATYGGFFLFLGAGCLFSQSEAAFQVAGTAWCGAALARLMSVAIDKSRSCPRRSRTPRRGSVAAQERSGSQRTSVNTRCSKYLFSKA